MGGSTIFRENYQKDAVKTTFTVSSCGDKSGLFNSSETAYSNGNVEMATDMVTRKIIQTDHVATYQLNNISNTIGNDSTHTNGLNEGVYGSRMRIIGNPDIVYKELHKAADMKKVEIVAARSGFNDDRNTSDFDILPDFNSLPSEITEIFCAVPDDIADDNEPLLVPGNNMFTSMASDITKEINSMVSTVSKISTHTTLERAKLAAKNKVERTKKQLELIKSLPESGSKKRILDAVEKGDLTALSANPSNENKVKNSTYNKDEYEAKVAEIIPEMIDIERQC